MYLVPPPCWSKFAISFFRRVLAPSDEDTFKHQNTIGLKLIKDFGHLRRSSYLNKGISAREICNLASLVLALQRKMCRTTEYLSKTLTPQASSSSLCMDDN